MLGRDVLREKFILTLSLQAFWRCKVRGEVIEGSASSRENWVVITKRKDNRSNNGSNVRFASSEGPSEGVLASPLSRERCCEIVGRPLPMWKVQFMNCSWLYVGKIRRGVLQVGLKGGAIYFARDL